MERKLVRQGREALTVTLPAKWLRSRALRAGDSIFINEKNNELTISTSLTAVKTETAIDITDCRENMAYLLVQGKYIEGYDKVTLIHNNQNLTQEIVTSLLGMIIEEHAQTKTVYRSVIAIPEENFSAVLRRATYILLQQAKTVVRVAEKKSKPKEVKAEEKLLDLNILYCLRYLNKYENNEKSYRYFLLCSDIELAGDILTGIANHIGNDKELAKKISQLIEAYIKMLFAGNVKKLYTSIKEFRDSLKNKTFAEGLTYSLAETLNNFIGYLMEDKDYHKNN